MNQVIVKFKDFIKLPYVDEVAQDLVKLEVIPWNNLKEKYLGISIKRLYTRLSPEEIFEMVEEAKQLDTEYVPFNFLSVFLIDCQTEADAQNLAESLNNEVNVEYAYVNLEVVLAGINDGPNKFAENQLHLDEAPGGINAYYAGTIPGGDLLSGSDSGLAVCV